MTLTDRPRQPAAVLARIRARQLPEPAERRRLRKAAEATLQDVADGTGATVAAVSCWERGIYTPSRRYRAAYLELLDGFDAVARERAQK